MIDVAKSNTFCATETAMTSSSSLLQKNGYAIFNDIVSAEAISMGLLQNGLEASLRMTGQQLGLHTWLNDQIYALSQTIDDWSAILADQPLGAEFNRPSVVMGKEIKG